MSDLLFGALAGDMGALNALFVLLIPVFAVGSFVRWLWLKITGQDQLR